MFDVTNNPIADIKDLEHELTTILMRGLQGGLYEADLAKVLDSLTEYLLEDIDEDA